MFSSLSALSGDIVKQYIMKVINVFKAYTVELKRINIYYIFDYKWMNRIKLLTFMYTQAKFNLTEATLDQLMEDYFILNNIYNSDSFHYESEMTIETFKYIMDRIRLRLKEKFNVDLALADSYQDGFNEIKVNYIENTLIESKTIMLSDKMFKDYIDKSRLLL